MIAVQTAKVVFPGGNVTSWGLKAFIVRSSTNDVVDKMALDFGVSGIADKREIAKALCEMKNWKREHKRHVLYPESSGFPPKSWERCFNCTPFEDQVRFYAITDPSDTKLLGAYFDLE